MEQRRLRLGDILDDYCPRERRVTNHAVVAMIEDHVKQTRCTTCDAEHAYKGARVPRRKKKETTAVLYKDVLSAMPETSPSAPAVQDVPDFVAEEPSAAPDEEPSTAPDLNAIETAGEDSDGEQHPVDAAESREPPTTEQPRDLEDGPVHRPLIRATLPRPEGQKDARPLPEFTIRQSGGRGGNAQFRGADPRGKTRGRGGHVPQGANGNRAHGGARFTGMRPAGQGRGGPGGRGAAPGFRSGQQSRHGGKKRSR
jgi:hypothetical protein